MKSIRIGLLCISVLLLLCLTLCACSGEEAPAGTEAVTNAVTGPSTEAPAEEPTEAIQPLHVPL